MKPEIRLADWEQQGAIKIVERGDMDDSDSEDPKTETKFSSTSSWSESDTPE